MRTRLAFILLFLLAPLALLAQSTDKKWEYGAAYEKAKLKYACPKKSMDEEHPPRLQFESNKAVMADTTLRGHVAEMFAYFTLDAIENPPMFGGHYLVHDATTMSGEHKFMLIDVLDGKIYGPFQAHDGWKMDITSRLALFDPPNDEGMYGESDPVPQAYLWNEKTHSFSKLDLGK